MILDLDFLEQANLASGIVVYQYRSDLLRRVIRNKVMSQFVAKGLRPFLFETPQELVQGTPTFGLFAPANIAALIDLGARLERVSEKDWDESSVDALRHILGQADTLSAMVLVPDRMTRKLTATGDWPLINVAGVISIASPPHLRQRDIPRLVHAVAMLRTTAPDDDLRAYAQVMVQDAWFDTRDCEALAARADQVLVEGYRRNDNQEGQSERRWKARDGLVSALAKVIKGTGGREEVLRHFESYRDGPEIVQRLLSATARLMLILPTSPGHTQLRVDMAYRLAVWTLLLLNQTPRLAAARSTLWLSADLRMYQLRMLLDLFFDAPTGLLAVTPTLSEGAYSGAKCALAVARVPSERLAERLPELVQRGRLCRAFDHALWDGLDAARFALSEDQPIAYEQAGGAPAILTSLDHLVGRDAASFIFRQRFMRRGFDRPLLLVGPDDVGKRVVASLMARLYACDTATAEEPVACGHCFGCVTLALSKIEVDVPDFLHRVPGCWSLLTYTVDSVPGRDQRSRPGVARDGQRRKRVRCPSDWYGAMHARFQKCHFSERRPSEALSNLLRSG